MYPKCAFSFKNWVTKNKNFLKVYNDLGNPTPFDVTLSDSLQNLDKQSQINYSITNKMNLYYNIFFNYQPKNIEVGSIVSEKVSPIFKNTLEIFNTIDNYQKSIYQSKEDRQNIYILIQNHEKMKKVTNNKNINHFSFITSVSNSFQLKNTNMTLEESDKDIYNILDDLEFNIYREKPYYIKLYVSCINECPIDGKINNYLIVKRLRKLYNGMKVNSFVLTDTCGTLKEDDFEYIVDSCSYFGIPKSKFALHLHVKKGREEIVERIIHKALDKNITKFDVSLLDIECGSINIDKINLLPNLSHELYYKFLCNYIINKT